MPGRWSAGVGQAGEARFGGRRRSRSQEQAQRRRCRRRDGPAEEGRHHLQGPVPVPRREDALVHRHARPRVVEVLRLRRGRRHLQLRDEARRAVVPGGAQGPRREGRRRARRADDARGRPQEAPPRRPRERDRLLPRGPDRLEGRRRRARLPPRPGLHRRDDREVPARLRAGRLGHARPAARRQARRPGRGARRGRARPAAAVGAGRRLRPVPRAGHLPDPRRERLAGRAGRAVCCQGDGARST